MGFCAQDGKRINWFLVGAHVQWWLHTDGLLLAPWARQSYTESGPVSSHASPGKLLFPDPPTPPYARTSCFPGAHGYLAHGGGYVAESLA